MYRKEELIWGNGEDVERSLKPVKEEISKNSAAEYNEKGKFVIPDNEINEDGKMDQFLRANATKEDYMKEKQFIEGFVQDNDKDLVNSRLSERHLFSDGCKNPFMIDSDYSKDIDMASKYIKFGKK